MECPRCKKDTAVLVSKQNKKRVREKKGLVHIIIGLPFAILRFIKRVLFGRKESYHDKQHWHCNYCGHDFEQKKEKK